MIIRISVTDYKKFSWRYFVCIKKTAKYMHITPRKELTKNQLISVITLLESL